MDVRADGRWCWVLLDPDGEVLPGVALDRLNLLLFGIREQGLHPVQYVA